MSTREAALLQQLDLDIPLEKWTLYLDLKEKRQKETITNDEYEVLISLTNDVEMANAKRINALAELSQIRNIPIRILMKQLDLKPFFKVGEHPN